MMANAGCRSSVNRPPVSEPVLKLRLIAYYPELMIALRQLTGKLDMTMAMLIRHICYVTQINGRVRKSPIGGRHH